MAGRLIAVNATRETILAAHARTADTMLKRMVGLLRDASLTNGDGLWIVPCNSIHSFGMRFVFDAVFLDRSLKIVHLHAHMPPWRMSRMVFTAHSVLELPQGAIALSKTQIGDQIEMGPVTDSVGRGA